ncbi:ORF6N domain-containing protein [Robiginitalea sediminis]|uniref:ORF6N domain-containing protein n=1 Tax=Robiginitalea sediminis TaxID=1982593 RepID=UPI0018E9BE06|nr:ORF6N domain-containing protein [Robiginitalea sediminis]
MSKELSIPNEVIIKRIHAVRGQKVMLDRDLAELYGVETKRLKEAVRRNIDRFPEDFMFEMTKEELAHWRSQIASSNPSDKMGLRYPPFCFTEYGILMLSSVLGSDKAIAVNIQIIKTFVELRKLANNYQEIMKKIEKMESQYSQQFQEIYQVLQRLIEKPKDPPRKPVGYKK